VSYLNHKTDGQNGIFTLQETMVPMSAGYILDYALLTNFVATDEGKAMRTTC